MNNVSPEKKEAILKTLAIIGFLFLIVFIAWAAVKAVNVAPKAFSSLASIAESIDQYKDALGENDEELEMVKDEETIISGGPLVIGWTKDEQPGTYAFTYDCIDGVTVDLVDDEGLRAIDCDTSYNLGDTDTITIVTESDMTEPTTLSYTVVFTHENDPSLTRSGSDTVAVNPNEEDTSSEDVVTNTPPQNGEDLPNLGAPAPAPTPRPTPAPTYTYTLPVSDPNGRVDLGTIFLGTGSIVNNSFRAGTIEQNATGAFQFEVKNYGTKTSEAWTYSVTLPDGDTYTSPKQTALKPNERAVITLGFPTDSDSSHTFKVTIKTDNDKNSNNNSFSKTVSFSR